MNSILVYFFGAVSAIAGTVFSAILLAHFSEWLHHTPIVGRVLGRIPRRLVIGLGASIIQHEHFDRDLIGKLVLNARKRIWILDTWIGSSGPIPELVPGQMPTPGVQVRLLVEGDKDLLTRRLEAVCQARSGGYGDDAIAALKSKCNQYEWNFEVREFDTLPPFHLILIDDHLFIGFYWADRISTQGPYIEILDVRSRLYLDTEQMFDRLFNSVQPKIEQTKPLQAITV